MIKCLAENDYLLKLPLELCFCLIFNVEDLFGHHGHQDKVSEDIDIQLPLHYKPGSKILSLKIKLYQLIKEAKYQNFLVKLRNKPHSDNTWIMATDFQKLNLNLGAEFFQMKERPKK